MILTLKNQTTAKILLLVTIAPNSEKFGMGPRGVNWDHQTARQHAQEIRLYLENALNFARTQQIPVVDAYSDSIVKGEGNLEYINEGDYIHPSDKGKQYIAGKISEKLIKLGWIN